MTSHQAEILNDLMKQDGYISHESCSEFIAVKFDEARLLNPWMLEVFEGVNVKGYLIPNESRSQQNCPWGSYGKAA